MSIPNLPRVDGDMKLEDLANLVARMIKEMEWLLTGNLDVHNIRAKSITADRMKVDQLSAISADLGHITAGLVEAVTIIGSLIKTAEFGQRVELSSTENLLKAINANGGEINIVPNVDGNPALVFVSSLSGGAYLYQDETSINLISTLDIYLSASGGSKVRFSDWNNIINSSSGKSLQQEFDDVQQSITNIYNALGNLSARVSALENA